MAKTAKTTPSIRRQLILMVATVLIVINALALWSVHIYANRSAKESYDRLLYGSALQMAENITLLDAKVFIDLPVSAFETLALSTADRAFYAIMDSQSRVLTGYKDLPSVPFAPLQRQSAEKEKFTPMYYETSYRGENVRFIALGKRLLEADNVNDVFIIVGQTLGARRAAAAEISQMALQFVTVFFFITLSLLLFVIWRVLRPLQAIKQAIMARSPLELSPLETNVPSEIAPLLKSINYFMAQLQNTLSRLKRFTAEAAHQIRTPLAGLNSQAQNAIDESDDTLRQKQLQHILESSKVLTNTVNQLLNRATLTHRFQSHPFSPVSLEQVTKDTCRELVVWALDQQVEIAYVGDSHATINGDEFALKQMLQNIIENAIKYSPKGGTVEVELMVVKALSEASIVLQIRDQGVGVPDQDKEHIFEYFYRRPDNFASGSGIGLSIAKEVAEHHQARFHLKDNQPTGLIVEVIFAAQNGGAL
ncbi:sensor histidine kinase [Marinomonas sp. M1K-6]|uniref:histidine kinase n=1 Tax=Marinomonas profundi TaxID=2726122 RepID=A0A847QWX8_9GAMM|nr:sensor histidine kinase [Marinomonas profundi]NLQ17998.1 sensor histidine kinase [Marinomonas profundi]UDV01723.1 sensor histidine kinase N-terminal domain-containing protein [Marinomonas profundi]